MAGGLFRAPVRTFRAFVRGRRDRSLYGLDLEPLLDKTVRELRSAQTHSAATASVLDTLLFAVATIAGLVIGSLLLAVVLLFLPLGFMNQARRTAELANTQARP